jgi:hypothetical protein
VTQVHPHGLRSPVDELVGEGELVKVLIPELVLRGRLVFDSRDPRDRKWEKWNPIDSRRRVCLPDGHEIGAWTEVTAVEGGLVSFAIHYTFPDEELVSTATLRFRTEDELRASLQAASFTVE